jgi:hypothetical protein
MRVLRVGPVCFIVVAVAIGVIASLTEPRIADL